MRRLVTAVIVVAAMVSGVPGRAAADSGVPYSTGTAGNKSRDGQRWRWKRHARLGVAARRRGRGWSGPCPPGQTVVWGQSQVMADAPGAGQNGLPVAGSTSTPLYCDGVFQGLIVTPPGGGSPTVSPAQLAQRALVSAPFQPIRVQMSPPSTREAVNFPIFLSLGSGFAPVTATASAGGVTSTVTITPNSVTWIWVTGTRSPVRTRGSRSTRPSPSTHSC